jgi:putative transposase
MARPARIEFSGAFYHLTSRGQEKQTIFSCDKDCVRLFDYLELAHVRLGAIIHVYCLMKNHFHLILETPHGNLSKIMQLVNSSYSAYFNARYERSGHLFQGRYNAIVIEADSYIQTVSRYVHLNPVRAGIVSSPESYIWSSYRDYLGIRHPSTWLKTEFLLSSFGETIEAARIRYSDFVALSSNQPSRSPFEEMKNSYILGTDDFINRIKGRGSGLGLTPS